VRVCVWDWGWWVGGGDAGRVACSQLIPQIVVRCRSLSAMRFGQEGNVIGFVQSSWQPTPADICSLLTTQTYLHQGTHTHTLSHRTDMCAHTDSHGHTHNHTCAHEGNKKIKKHTHTAHTHTHHTHTHTHTLSLSHTWANFVIMESSVCQLYAGLKINAFTWCRTISREEEEQEEQEEEQE